MKNSSGLIFVLALAGVLNAEEARSGAVVPQPRVRLDPANQRMIVEPKTTREKAAVDSIVRMSPYIVKSTPVESSGPPEPVQPTGPFSSSEGGWIGQKDLGEMRIEAGVWPYRNVLWKVERFKADQKHVGTQFVRMSW